MAFTCTQLSKTFATPDGDVVALAPLDLSVADHEFVCVVGPSGCGKTTLLRILAGILEPTTGRAEFRGGHDVPDGRPATAMVFQEHGLFPWLDVLDNVAFGLEAMGVARRERRAAAAELVDRLGLGGFAHAYPHQLSGGMRQRVGIARAFLTEPRVLLMDEPFGSLDAQTKLVLQEELLETWRHERREVVYVTHDIDEAIRLGDRVLVMSGRPGRVIADLPVGIDRPRTVEDRDHPVARELYSKIWNALEDEVRRGTTAG